LILSVFRERTGVIAVAATAAATAYLSFLKSYYCIENYFQAPLSYTHMCYSDISALFGARALGSGAHPYQDSINSMEYPVGTGYIASLIARISDDFTQFFILNLIPLALLFIATAVTIYLITDQLWPLFVLAPAVIATLYINWDLWAIFPLILALRYLSKQRFELAGFLFGLSIAIKFFAIYLLIPIAIFYYIYKERRVIKFFIYAAATVFILNISTAIYYFDGWSRFFIFNRERGADLGSLWLVAQFNFDISFGKNLNLAIALTTFSALLFAYQRILPAIQAERFPVISDLYLLLFITLAIVFLLNKVYSPQYILWLTPLGLLALTGVDKSQRIWFWIWQCGEGAYYLGVWLYLAAGAGADGIGQGFYTALIALRALTTAVFVIALIRARLALPQKEAFNLI